MYNLGDGDFSDSHRLGMQKSVIYLDYYDYFVCGFHAGVFGT